VANFEVLQKNTQGHKWQCLPKPLVLGAGAELKAKQVHLLIDEKPTPKWSCSMIKLVEQRLF